MTGTRVLDPYATLGVPRHATALQVARAHRQLAKEHHPDLHEGAAEAAERMRRINEAWAILSNPARRADFDRSHPLAGVPVGGHWAASRSPIQPMAPSSTRTWATWRATAAQTRAALERRDNRVKSWFRAPAVHHGPSRCRRGSGTPAGRRWLPVP
jgi:curved DNA-binding protein CbpA